MWKRGKMMAYTNFDDVTKEQMEKDTKYALMNTDKWKYTDNGFPVLQETTGKPIVFDEDKMYFYDIEVFEYNNMVVFKDIHGNLDKIFTSDKSGLEKYSEFLEEGYLNLYDYLKDKILIGFNNYHYDDFVLQSMVSNKSTGDIKALNDKIIYGKWDFQEKQRTPRVNNITLDTREGLPPMVGLSMVECNMGKSIIESDVSFTINRPLSPQENLEVLEYCMYDVKQVVEIYKDRKYSHFKPKESLVNMLPEFFRHDYNAYRWSNNSIAVNIIKPERMINKPYFNRKGHEDGSILDYMPYQSVVDMWEEIFTLVEEPRTKTVSVDDFGLKIDFAWGGLHATQQGFIERENVKLLDVSSMYPNLILIVNGLQEKSSFYNKMLDYRFHLRDLGYMAEQEPYKLALNSVYGQTRYIYSKIYCPKLTMSICIIGQTVLYQLVKRLHEIGAEIIQANTDGVTYKYDRKDKLDLYIKEQWENEFNLHLDLEYYDKWVQKDVNNYVAIRDNGKVITKGGDTNLYHSQAFYSNNNHRIVDIALTDMLLYNTPIEHTIVKNLDDPAKFAMTLNKGGTFDYVGDDNGNKYLNVNRAFACKGTGNFQLFKYRNDGSRTIFPNLPRNIFIYNGELGELHDFRDRVDLQYYYDLAHHKLESWRNG